MFFENFGTLPINKFSAFLKTYRLKKNLISKSGIRIGAKYFYVPNF